MKTDPVHISSDITVGAAERLLLIAGPCQIESLEHCLLIGSYLKELCKARPINYVFKSSFDKANRTSSDSMRGPGIESGLGILSQVRKQLNIPVITDVHEASQVAPCADAVDILQIPAFLCRQTDLLDAAGKSSKPVLIKKGQFLHPADMRYAAGKIAATGNNKILLCERGTCFGYRDLVVDPRSLIIMRESGYPVIMDASHGVQSMGGADGASGGSRQYIAPLCRAAVSIGVDGLFIECHPDPDSAPSDKASMLPLDQIEQLLDQVCALWEIKQQFSF